MIAPAARAAPPSSTPAAERLSLPSALTLVRQSPALATADSDLAAADAEAREADGADTFRVTLGATVGAQRGLADGRAPSRTIDVAAGISRLLPTGGTASLRVTGADAVTDDATPHLVSSQVALQLKQPLARGTGRNASDAAQDRARVARDATRLERVRVATTVERDLVIAYWELAFAWQELAVREHSLDLASAQLRRVRAGMRQGQIAPSEGLALEQGIAQRTAQVARARQNITRRSLALRTQLALPIAPGAIAIATDPLPVLASDEPPDADAVLARALTTSPELAVLEARARGATIDVEVTANGQLPALDLTIEAGPAGLGADPGGALRSLGNGDGYQATAGLELRWDIGGAAAEGRAMKARVARQRVRIDSATARAQLAAAVIDAVEQRDTARAVIDLATRERELAAQGVTAEQARFDLGKATSFDVLARQQELADAELRRVRGVVDYLQARAIVDALTGDLPRRGR